MKLCSLLSVAVLLATTSACTKTGMSECQVEPEMFCQPYAKWEESLSPDMKTTLLGINEENLPRLSWQFEAGVRGEFELWQDNEFSRFFKARGYNHPDYMSRPVIQGFVAYLKRRPVDMDDVTRKAAPPELSSPSSGMVKLRQAQTNNSFKPSSHKIG